MTFLGPRTKKQSMVIAAGGGTNTTRHFPIRWWRTRCLESLVWNAAAGRRCGSVLPDMNLSPAWISIKPGPGRYQGMNVMQCGLSCKAGLQLAKFLLFAHDDEVRRRR